ncbi:Hydroxyacid oxidase 1 [Mortierella sp. GBA35]|nr:Hydroxyacid oxidase 1 [Mortierella sp. AD031]KAF9107247.1 Hydroxyacid oxidase 1 [Mortierella sp. GBA35]KAG0217689.1 Hydroxyacid oxidase 1 [Mortierella sp. NVP41]
MSRLPQLVPISIADLEHNAHTTLSLNALDYYRSGANDMQTLKDNEEAYTRYRLRPRILRDVSKVDTQTTLLGHTVSSPICIAPTAMQRLAHDSGERATARAAAKAKKCMILSSWSTTSAEETIAAGKEVPLDESSNNGLPLYWMQLYVYKDRAVTEQLIRRVEKAGYKALVITVDTPFLGRRLADVRNVFKLPGYLTMANFENKDSKVTMANILDQPHKVVVGNKQVSTPNAKDKDVFSYDDKTGAATQTVVRQESSLAAYVVSQIDPTLNWSDIAWVRSITKLPVVVKGVLTAEDAKIAADIGVEGILVSNHGGRQLDGVLATIDALPEVLDAVKGRNVEVYIDGGVRKGTDVLKALALGAKAVFLGRPILYGLAHDGEEGVTLALNLIQQEFELAMALAGCCKIADINRDHVQHGTTARSKL